MADTIRMPKLGFDMAEGTLVRWAKKEGEAVSKGEVLAEIETDKATVEVESSATGLVRALLVEEGAVVPVSTPIAVVGTKDEPLPELEGTTAGRASEVTLAAPPPARLQLEAGKAAETGPSAPEGIRRASPLARRIAQDHQLDLGRVQGTGPGGRIVRHDIEAVLAEAARAPVLEAVQPSGGGADQTVPQGRMRQAVGRRMAEAKRTVPHFYVTHEYRVDSLLELRAQFNALVKEEEKLSVNDLIIKAAALTLRKFPHLNASLQEGTILVHAQVNIGVAVAVEGGLLTVVCRAADQKPLRQISREVREMAARARAGKVRPEDIEGSTFSISNLGMYEVEDFAAIINPPEAAILAVGSARQVPVAASGILGVGWRMKATLSVDHRVSDGAEGARFLQALAGTLEAPLQLFLPSSA
jgi:pyruvate dehydrogenase E2 component (dihydrolipoamide acetyltransferase)